MTATLEATAPVTEAHHLMAEGDPSLQEQRARNSRALEYLRTNEPELQLARLYVERAKADPIVKDLRRPSLENGDRETLLHSDGVALAGVVIGQRLGCSKQDLDYIATAGLVHDVGKAADPEIQALVLSPREFTDEEHRKLERHPYLSAEKILETTGWPDDKQKAVHDISLAHHAWKRVRQYGERPDGDPVPSIAHALGDITDSLFTPRGYRPFALERSKGLEIIRQEFDVEPALVLAAFGEDTRRFGRDAERVGQTALEHAA